MRGTLGALLLLIGVAACDGPAGEDRDGGNVPTADEAAEASGGMNAGAARGAAGEGEGHAHSGEGEPASLLAIMQELGTHITSLTYGLMTEDAELVAASAEAIAHHPPIASGDIDRIRRELGDDMAEFERLDEAVHEASLRLHEAAGTGDAGRILDRLAEVQRGCVACHERFRAPLRTNPETAARPGAAPR